MTDLQAKNPKVYLNKTVLEAALERIRFIFDEFQNVVVNWSGGKDSTVVLHLALQVAREKGRTPLPVLFIDQEAEWQATIDLTRRIMAYPDVKPMWFQIPLRLFNATSFKHDWLFCWEEGKEWIREREPIAYTENKYGTDRFKELFEAIPAVEFAGQDCAMIAGVRAEESPARYLGITGNATYKWITWGRKHPTKGQYTFYPIYDWSYTDVWKAIHDHKWPYNRVYDYQYQKGIAVMDMRVSNLHHETALKSLFYLQEAEPDTYDRFVRRLNGIDAATKFGDDLWVDRLPFAFSSWKEYRDYLLEHLIEEGERRERIKKAMYWQEDYFEGFYGDLLYKHHVNIILTNDWTGTKLRNLQISLRTKDFRAWKRRRQNERKSEVGSPVKGHA